jgi:hypothetical protein
MRASRRRRSPLPGFGRTITERPTGGDFDALEVRSKIAAAKYVTQCNESADGERVWMTTDTGHEPSSACP